MRKARLTFRPIHKATSAPKAPAPDGALEVARTTRGKPIYTSGADAGTYNDQDHLEAAQVHAKLHAHHEAKRAVHHSIAGDDDDWVRAEQHHGETERHDKLAEHHMAVAGDHFIAAGARGSGKHTLGLGAKGLELSKLERFSEKEKADAVGRIKKRTHDQHPGGLTTREHQAYRELFPPPAPKKKGAAA